MNAAFRRAIFAAAIVLLAACQSPTSSSSSAPSLPQVTYPGYFSGPNISLAINKKSGDTAATLFFCQYDANYNLTALASGTIAGNQVTIPVSSFVANAPSFNLFSAEQMTTLSLNSSPVIGKYLYMCTFSIDGDVTSTPTFYTIKNPANANQSAQLVSFAARASYIYKSSTTVIDIEAPIGVSAVVLDSGGTSGISSYKTADISAFALVSQ